MRSYAAPGLTVTVLVLLALAPASTVGASSRPATRSTTELSAPTTATAPDAAANETELQVIRAAQLQAKRNANTLAQNIQALAATVSDLVAASGISTGVSLVDLGGAYPTDWSLNGTSIFTAASTYKLAVLMMEAQNIASGQTDPNGLVCFEPDDYEDGWFDDYTPGACYTRTELAWRAGTRSDNTAGHMLVRDVGGAAVLNAWAASLGAANSALFDGNTTTADDLTALWVAEGDGRLGGSTAQTWLYPLLTQTTSEAGIPAGVASGVAVVHKTGTIDAVENDSALVLVSPSSAYVLTVMTDGLGGDAGWQLIAAISAAVWTFESSRPA